MFVFVQLSVSSSSLDISKWFLLISTSPYNTFTEVTLIDISKHFKVKHNACIPTLYNWDTNPVPQMMHCFSFCFSYSFPFQTQFLLTFLFLIGWLAVCLTVSLFLCLAGCLFSYSFLTGLMVTILLLALCIFLAVRLCWLPSYHIQPLNSGLFNCWYGELDNIYLNAHCCCAFKCLLLGF